MKKMRTRCCTPWVNYCPRTNNPPPHELEARGEVKRIKLYLSLVALYFPNQLLGSSSPTEKLATSVRHA